ncbi:MAG TPA: hypothetical protein VL201_05115, partial [Patescibacteria group bacterium]|nr:hypothetical protein [Patescibacteria group bacterium]
MIVLRRYVGIMSWLWLGNFLQADGQLLYMFNEQTIIKQTKEIERTLLLHNRIEKVLQCFSI